MLTVDIIYSFAVHFAVAYGFIKTIVFLADVRSIRVPPSFNTRAVVAHHHNRPLFVHPTTTGQLAGHGDEAGFMLQ